jgi:hypothetical protein
VFDYDLFPPACRRADLADMRQLELEDRCLHAASLWRPAISGLGRCRSEASYRCDRSEA